MPAAIRAPSAELANWTARQSVRTSSSTAGADAPKHATEGGANGKAKDVAQQFEAVYLRQMIEASMPKDSEALFGEGTSGTMWRSMFADTLATTLSKSGTVGITEMILKSQTDRLKEK